MNPAGGESSSELSTSETRNVALAERTERDTHDGAVQALTNKVKNMMSTADLELTARNAADVQRRNDDGDAIQKLWRILPELDSIADHRGRYHEMGGSG